MSDVLASMGLKPCGGNYKTLKLKAAQLGLDLPHGAEARTKRSSGTQSFTDADYFVDGVRRTGTVSKKRLLAKGRKLLCEADGCNVGESWLGASISLQVDHIDGDHFNNRIENLRLLCPNCHSQTETFGGRGNRSLVSCGCGRRKKAGTVGCPHGLSQCVDCPTIVLRGSVRCMPCSRLASRVVDWPTSDIVRAEVARLGFSGYGRELGVSDNAVRKFLRNN